MGGGRGGGFFAGTDGWRASEAFDKGTLVAAAARNTATDAGSTSGGMLDALRPWWSYPYGHPEKTKKIEMLQKALMAAPPMLDTAEHTAETLLEIATRKNPERDYRELSRMLERNGK